MPPDNASDENARFDDSSQGFPSADPALERLATLYARWPDLPWLGVALLVGCLVSVSYLLTHPYPAYGAGLYLEIAEQIRTGGYAIPDRIPGYTRSGVPFAYPPLQFYLAALAVDVLGVGPFTYTRYLPAVLTVLYLVPFYGVARELLASRRRAGVATGLFAVTPSVLQWHLSAGGIVRAMAMLWVLAGTYAGIRVFRDGEHRWLVAAVALFGLTVLTHPTYSAVFGLTYLLLVARFDRSASGVALGAVVATGGLLLASPWWLQVAATHGTDVFFAAAGTHSGLAGDAGRFVTEFVYPLAPDAETGFFVVAYAGALYELSRRRWFLPAWLFVTGYVVGKPRFQFVAGSLLAAQLLFDDVVPRVTRVAGSPPRRRVARLLLVTVIVLGAVGVGAGFSASALETHDGSTTMPPFVDAADEEAMEWAATNTAPSSRFVVLGDAAEWFPLRTDRTILIGPWGVEWTTPARYDAQLERYVSISSCEDAACLSTHLDEGGYDPDYVYLPKGHYTVRGDEHRLDDGMRSSVAVSDRYDPVYENEGVLVVRIDDGRDTH